MNNYSTQTSLVPLLYHHETVLIRLPAAFIPLNSLNFFLFIESLHVLLHFFPQLSCGEPCIIVKGQSQNRMRVQNNKLKGMSSKWKQHFESRDGSHTLARLNHSIALCTCIKWLESVSFVEFRGRFLHAFLTDAPSLRGRWGQIMYVRYWWLCDFTRARDVEQDKCIVMNWTILARGLHRMQKTLLWIG